MSAPPKYADLGKAARDMFKKNYDMGAVKLELKTKTESGVEFKTTGNGNISSGAVAGDLETKYKFKDYGLEVTEKWNTKGVLSSEFSIEDKIAQGFKLGAETSLLPNTRATTAVLTAAYKQDKVHINSSLNLFNGPSIAASATFAYEQFRLGYDTSYSVSGGKLTKSNVALGYVGKDFTLHTAVNDGAKVESSVHQKVNKDLSVAALIGFNTASSATSFQIGSHYTLDKGAFVKAKLDNKGQAGVSYTQSLRKGVQMTLSAGIDGKNLSTDSHHVGVSFVLSP